MFVRVVQVLGCLTNIPRDELENMLLELNPSGVKGAILKLVEALLMNVEETKHTSFDKSKQSCRSKEREKREIMP